MDNIQILVAQPVCNSIT